MSEPDQEVGDEIPTSVAEVWPMITELRDLARGYGEQRGIGPVRTAIGLTLTGVLMLSFAVGPIVAARALRRLLERRGLPHQPEGVGYARETGGDRGY